MESEEKVEKLKELFQSLSRPLLRAILCNNEVDGNLTAAVRWIQKFEPAKTTKMPYLPAVAAEKELKEGSCCTPDVGFSQKEKNWTGEGKLNKDAYTAQTLDLKCCVIRRHAKKTTKEE